MSKLFAAHWPAFIRTAVPLALGAAGASLAILYPTHYAAFCAVSSAGGV